MYQNKACADPQKFSTLLQFGKEIPVKRVKKSGKKLLTTPCGKLVKFFGGLKSNHYIWALVYTQMKRKRQF